jgi:hypothetical protein
VTLALALHTHIARRECCARSTLQALCKIKNDLTHGWTPTHRTVKASDPEDQAHGKGNCVLLVRWRSAAAVRRVKRRWWTWRHSLVKPEHFKVKSNARWISATVCTGEGPGTEERLAGAREGHPRARMPSAPPPDMLRRPFEEPTFADEEVTFLRSRAH